MEEEVLQSAIIFVEAIEIYNLIVEGDNMEVKEMRKHGSGGYNQCRHLIEGALDRLTARAFSFNRVRRNGNKVAHASVRKVKNIESDILWYGNFPQDTCNLASLDTID